MEKATEAEIYSRAERLLSANLAGRMHNPLVHPVWLKRTDEFVYRRDTDDGWYFMQVDCMAASRAPAFDHGAIASILAAWSHEDVDPARLPIDRLAPDRAGGLAVSALGGELRLDKHGTALGPVAATAKPVDPALLLSPKANVGLLTRDGNLWARDLTSNDERQLTMDGTYDRAYGVRMDEHLSYVPLRQTDQSLPPAGCVWSPDGEWILARRVDQTNTSAYPFLQAAPAVNAVRPVVSTRRIALCNDPGRPSCDFHIINLQGGRTKPVHFSPPVPSGYALVGAEPWWEPWGQVYVIAFSIDHSMVRLYEIDPASASAQCLLEEQSDSFIDLNAAGSYARPSIRILDGGRTVLWYSQRDDWGHLYLIEAGTGTVLAQVTKGEWAVRDIIRLNADDGTLLFTAGGREAGRDPYYRHIYKGHLDGRSPTLLTPEDADHNIAAPAASLVTDTFGRSPAVESLAPSGNYFVDTYSTVDEPPISVLRRVDGQKVMTLEQSDPSKLKAAGWRPPERFTVKADDQTTDLYGVMYLPSDFDPARRYPVVEDLYGGPQTAVTPKSYGPDGRNMQALAELGFVVITLDARGTPLRSKTFHDVIFGRMDDFCLADHVAALRQLTERHAFMDVNRIGVQGHSYGGYGAARAILLYPEIYKVAVASAGAHALDGMTAGQLKYLGPTGRDRAPRNSDLAERLTGKLMLVYGDLDGNTPAALTLQFADALIRANKDFDLLCLPNRDHYFTADPYFVRRRWDYFVRHLAGREPPAEYQIGAAPGSYEIA